MEPFFTLTAMSIADMPLESWAHRIPTIEPPFLNWYLLLKHVVVYYFKTASFILYIYVCVFEKITKYKYMFMGDHHPGIYYSKKTFIGGSPPSFGNVPVLTMAKMAHQGLSHV